MDLLKEPVIVYIVETASKAALRQIVPLLDRTCPSGNYELRRGPYNRIDRDLTCVGRVLAEIQRIIEENP